MASGNLDPDRWGGPAIRPRDLRHYSCARVETNYEALRRFTEVSDPEPWRRLFADAVAACRRARQR